MVTAKKKVKTGISKINEDQNYHSVKSKLWLGIGVSVVVLVVLLLILIPLLGKKEVVGEAVSTGMLCEGVEGTIVSNSAGNDVLCGFGDTFLCEVDNNAEIKLVGDRAFLCTNSHWDEVSVSCDSAVFNQGTFLCSNTKEYLYCSEKLQHTFFNGVDNKVYRCVDGQWVEKISAPVIVPNTEPAPTLTVFQVEKNGKVQCIDSDNGVNFKVKGTTRGYNEKNQYVERVDYCYQNGMIAKPQEAALGIAEFFCSATGSVSPTYAQCGNGEICRDGACVTK